MWLCDVSIVLADRVIACGALRLEEGRIAEIRETSGSATHTVYPGFVDMHGDMIELELEPRPGVDFPMEVAVTHLDARLAAAGVTTAYAGVSFSRNAKDGDRRSYTHTSQIIRALKAHQNGLRVDHRVHARFDITFTAAIETLEGLLNSGSVDLVSVMDHTPGQGQYRDLERLIAYRTRGGKVSAEEARSQIQHSIDSAVSTEEIHANLLTVSRLCKAHGIAVASHDDDTVEKANLMADIGAVISEFPVTMDAAKVAAERGMMTAMGAPNAMRGQSYSGNLSARDAHAAGLLQILAADYHPAAILPAIKCLADTDPDGLAGAVRLASANPAQALGLTDRGEIAVGKRADLVLENARGKIVTTLREGEAIFSDGSMEFTRKECVSAA
ncbi:alpha-D-ribose 1-methylphosphonate 5-triphosphate diphosphatase [Epibacterium sp. SM1969]|uniref:Alpha-D-ribose 1-methylphosphonate 5-triphosphate diphosphatase n=1 Tax=Tritonibacter aquimaris TaxID=2663379 RepID=A0A844AKY7_9RHOB|nr:alpha-D-ribose 1-methylphosphonate 5-triphosphate diphosphatase [Tritonibacter aquimaris]MQY42530.1 alpha-D-ribose 1-methylphosphonate 5-triphosphate diphosphatase [Tritonibacter aquimaris]